MLNHSALPRESDTPYLPSMLNQSCLSSVLGRSGRASKSVPVLCGIPYRRGLVRIDVGYNIDPNAAADSR